MTTQEQDHRCFTCTTLVPRWDAYCSKCIEQQQREQGDELEAFNAFHAYADAVAKRTR